MHACLNIHQPYRYVLEHSFTDKRLDATFTLLYVKFIPHREVVPFALFYNRGTHVLTTRVQVFDRALVSIWQNKFL